MTLMATTDRKSSEGRLTAEELADAIQAADLIVEQFNAKAREVADANGWTIGHAKTVMLAYLQDTSPDEAKTVAVALAIA